MITVTITPNHEQDDVYALLIEKERALRREGQGTLHRRGARKRGQEKWTHVRYKGAVKLQKCLGGVVVAEVSSASFNDEWQLLSSFVGFVVRHLRASICTVSLGLSAADN